MSIRLRWAKNYQRGSIGENERSLNEILTLTTEVSLRSGRVSRKLCCLWHFKYVCTADKKHRGCSHLDALFPYIVYANSDGSGETARMRRFAWIFTVRQCDNYLFHMGWLIFLNILINFISILKVAALTVHLRCMRTRLFRCFQETGSSSRNFSMVKYFSKM